MSAVQTIAGRAVCRDDGRPVPFAVIEALLQARGGVQRIGSTVADAGGRFSISVPVDSRSLGRQPTVFLDVARDQVLLGRSAGIPLGQSTGDVQVSCSAPLDQWSADPEVEASPAPGGATDTEAGFSGDHGAAAWRDASSSADPGAVFASKGVAPRAERPVSFAGRAHGSDEFDTAGLPRWLRQAVTALVASRPVVQAALGGNFAAGGRP